MGRGDKYPGWRPSSGHQTVEGRQHSDSVATWAGDDTGAGSLRRLACGPDHTERKSAVANSQSYCSRVLSYEYQAEAMDISYDAHTTSVISL